MRRTNIFELMKNNTNMARDVYRMDRLFSDDSIIEVDQDFYSHKYYTLEDFVDEFCFYGWVNRGRCLNSEDYLDTLGYNYLLSEAEKGNIDAFLTIIEIIYNFLFLSEKCISLYPQSMRYCDEQGAFLRFLLDDCLSEYNQKAYYYPEEEKCIIAEDSPQVTAAAEATEPEIAIEIVRYNHRQLAGDITKKKAILKQLGVYLEGQRKAITEINASLYGNITGSLNNLNIRHNNISPENKSYYHEAVARMTDEELEKHYDDLYQMILLAILEIDNKERQRKMKELVQTVCAKASE